MIALHSVEIDNFRGYQKIAIDFENDAGVTFISGDNGSGKTTMINAISWCLYGNVIFHTINENNDIFSRGAKNGDETRVRVILATDDKTYDFTRKAIKGSTMTPILTVLEINSDGNSTPLSPVDAESVLRRLIPRDIRNLFFLNGDNFSTDIFSSQNAGGLKNSIYRVSEIDILDNAIRHLYAAENFYTSQASKLTKNKEKVDKLNEDLEQHRSGVAGCEELIAENKLKLDELKKQSAELDKTISKTAAAREMLNQEKLLKERKKDFENTLMTAELNKTEIFQRSYHMALLNDFANEYCQALRVASQNGEIPPLIDPAMTQATLDSGCCALCTQKINDAIRALIEEKNNIYAHQKNLQFLTDGITWFSSVASRLDDEAYAMQDAVSAAIDSNEEIVKINNELKKVSDNLATVNTANIPDNPEAIRKHILNKITNTSALLAHAAEEKIKHENAIDAIQKQIDKILGVEAGAENYVAKIEKIRNLAKYILAVKDALEAKIRAKLEREVMETYSKILSSNRFDRITIDEDYRFTLYANGLSYTPDDLAVGQAKTLALSLIYALSKNLGYSETPIFIDNLYGLIASEHYDDITHMIQNLAADKQVFITYLASDQVSERYDKNIVKHDYRVTWDKESDQANIKEINHDN